MNMFDYLLKVRASISDRRQFSSTIFDPVISDATDYFPFGAPNRTVSSSAGYRYGFNGKELDKSNEFGTANVYDYGFRIYNPSIGRFLSVDPLTRSYPELTPYQFASNTPIWAVDLDGLEHYFATDGSYIGLIQGDPTVRVIKQEEVKGRNVSNIHESVKKGQLQYSNLAVLRNDPYKAEAMTAQELLDQAHVIYGEEKGERSDMYAHLIQNRENEFAHQYIWIENQVDSKTGKTDPITNKPYPAVKDRSLAYQLTTLHGIYNYTIFGVHMPNSKAAVEAYRKTIQEGAPQVDGGVTNFGYEYFYGLKDVDNIENMYQQTGMDQKYGYKVVPLGLVLQKIVKSIIDARMDPYTNDKWRKHEGWRSDGPRNEMKYDSENRPKKED
jgi:RHS repeat-associated protein